MKQQLHSLIVAFLLSLGAKVTNVRIQAHTWTKDKKGNTVVDTEASFNPRKVKESIPALIAVASIDSAGVEISTCEPALAEQCRELVQKVIELKRISEEFQPTEIKGYQGRSDGQQVTFSGYKIGMKPVSVDSVLADLRGL